jgi:autotransporter-associated beta strand protein
MKTNPYKLILRIVHRSWLHDLLLAASILLFLISAGSTAFAGSASWLSSPPTNNWNDPNDWSPATVPNGSADTATFGHSLTANISLSANTEVNGITFASAMFPSAYTITASPQTTLTISGPGITNNSGTTQTFVTDTNGPGAGGIFFTNSATAGNSTSFTNRGGTVSGADPGRIAIAGNSTAGSATITNNGGMVSGAHGGTTEFDNTSTAGSATLIANGGTSGGEGGNIFFAADSTGGTARVKVFGNGNLDLSFHNAPGVTIGSLEGSGNAFLGSNNLTVGSNNLSKTFSGAVLDSGARHGSLTKTGTGKLTLTGNENFYTGATTINGGTLLVKNKTGSATGNLAVQVNAGTLGGTGIIDGEVTVGTGIGTTSRANLLAGNGASSPGTLTINNSVTFQSDSTYKCVLNRSTGTASKLIASGVAINNNAQFAFTQVGTGTLAVGTVFRVIDNTSNLAISGRFRNLSNGLVLTSPDGTKFKVNYAGGTGNDLTLKVVP